MKSFSLTIVGVIVTVLSTFLEGAGIPFTDMQLSQFAESIVFALGVLLAYIGRVRQGDITWYGKRV